METGRVRSTKNAVLARALECGARLAAVSTLGGSVRLGRFIVATAALFASTEALADPCGMVPPANVGGPNVALKRTGPQKTYVFHDEGIETFVIRPGYTGNVEEFGMLVPFPAPPAIRKVPDAIFEQIAAAVDPPEVVVDLRPPMPYPPMSAVAGAAPGGAKGSASGLDRDEVRVLRQEAVGMYEVAVLEAGSAKALEKWMTEHKFRYPKGMDSVTEDYVKVGWCFVAVKTRVADKGATDPKPGMKKSPKTALPAGASFDGYIQGMGYRFPSKELVLPMRLSTYNDADDRRQVVYVLARDPLHFAGMADDLVKRQLPGKKLRSNVSDPLPLRIFGGTFADIPKAKLEQIASLRDPTPHNGDARALFTSDLIAAESKTLNLDHEEKEKELLNIGERLGLRGPEIDKVHKAVIDEEATKLGTKTLGKLDRMTLTVVDGQFPFELMRDKDLTFRTFKMKAEKNDAVAYDARKLGPGAVKEGVRVEADGTATGKPLMGPRRGWGPDVYVDTGNQGLRWGFMGEE